METFKKQSKRYLSDSSLEEKALEIIRLFKTEFTKGLNCAATYAHLDDIVPYLLYFGEADFVKQLIIGSGHFAHRGLIHHGDRTVSYQNDEFLGGMIAHYEQTGDNDVYALIEQALEGIEDLLVHKGFITTFYDIEKMKKSAITSPRTGLLLEVFVKACDLFPSMKELAFKSLDNWIATRFFKKFGLFPTKYYLGNSFYNSLYRNPCLPRLSLSNRLYKYNCSEFYKFGHSGMKKNIINIIYNFPNCMTAMFEKENSNLVYALIAAYRSTKNEKYKDALVYFMRSLMNIIGEKNYITEPICLNNHKKHKSQNINLGQNDPVIDVLCDMYCFVDQDERYLRLAERMAEYWLKLRWDNGLVPVVPNGDFNHIDNQTDFSVSLYRLYELTGEKRYREIGRSIFDSIVKYHYSAKGYVLSVNKDGQVHNPHVMIRHNALFLKCFILYDTQDSRIYQDDKLHELMKDR